MSFREQLLTRFPALTRLPSGCYVVGGAVRDLLLEKEPADVDIACVDPLSAAQAIRSRVIRLGQEEHLSAYRVVSDERIYDVAELLDGELSADLARRDFTVNAMAVDLDRDALIDPHGGRKDLEERVVRMVHASNFDDDPLRTLKGVRMAVRLEFILDEDTRVAIRQRASRIVDVAAERVTYELSIIFGCRRFRRAWNLLEGTGLASALGFERTADWNPEAEDPGVAIAGAYALLVRDPEPYAARWRWSDHLLYEVQALQRLIEGYDLVTLYDAGEAVARQLAPLLRALGRNGNVDLPNFSIQALLGGREIAELTGLAPGKELGRIKRQLLEAQIRREIQTREEAIAFVTASASR
jgi:tRNA nucleotidyltransferase/poly(A) polymerase